MHHRFSLIFGIASGLALSTPAASAQSVSTDALPGVNFSAYRTYAWVNTSAPAGMNPIMYQRILANFETQLASKGYRKGEPADLSLVVTIGAKQQTDIQTWGRFGRQTSVHQYTQGQLSLDVFDTKTQQALWHGQVSKSVNPDKSNPAAIDKAVSKLMKSFPATAATASPGS